MARQKLSHVEFPGGEIFDFGRGRQAVTRVTREDVRTLEVDEDLGLLYIGSFRMSVHSPRVGKWLVIAPPVPSKKA